ncbi:MAG TPA: ATP-binding protein [Actinophytocola sp.]|uniref:ATP-binding protein n=1 Tax=Actinophytocola sp. TaxID=1872138 RepID=UPI002DB9368E|nr:ATP-binding protein [Actinophytocola sp.]HEU5472900.1 ATP-binding protein [Actinophytocola sp.]
MTASVDNDKALCLDLCDAQVPPTAELRRWIRTHLRGLGEEAGYDLQLICTELIANAYEHGSMPGQVRIEPAGRDGLRIEVDDSSTRMPILRRPPPDSYRGRGLRMVEELCRSWGARRTRTGKTVWAELFDPSGDKDRLTAA